MNSTVLLALQSGLITLQMVNAGLATVHANPVIALIAGAVLGGFQYFVQHVGNQVVPPPPPAK